MVVFAWCPTAERPSGGVVREGTREGTLFPKLTDLQPPSTTVFRRTAGEIAEVVSPRRTLYSLPPQSPKSLLRRDTEVNVGYNDPILNPPAPVEMQQVGNSAVILMATSRVGDHVV
jgi:hypothetical protein